VERQWRSGVGVAADGALVYAAGPLEAPAQLARFLVHAGAVRAMELDGNRSWTALASYDPIIPGGTATALDGARLLPTTVQGPATFVEPTWATDFVTMSARTPPAGKPQTPSAVGCHRTNPSTVRRAPVTKPSR